MSDSSLLKRLVAHRTVGAVPREQLQWLAQVGELRVVEKGGILTATGTTPAALFVILDGHLNIRVNSGSGPRTVMEWHGGDVTGLLPYSRMKSTPGNVTAEERTELLAVEPKHFTCMIREHHELTSVMVHVMVDRARIFTSSQLLDEKMASLGRLAAGLAHELNNPASAVARSAKILVSELEVLDDMTKMFCQLNLSDTQCYSIQTVRDQRIATVERRTPLEAADLEDALAEWLDARGVTGVDLEPLAALLFDTDDLDELSETVGIDKVGTVLSHISAGQTVRRLAAEINVAASRIHALVAAVKGFTYMDQNTTLQPIDVERGLSDTITVMGSKAKAKSVDVQLSVAPDLPAVDGYGGELNQVWSNLIDNAIDATPRGNVRVSAEVEHGEIVVRIADDGPGIPDDVKGRIFDPFFTTKGVGQGTGIGLDISRRLVQRHRGSIEFESSASGTEFRVALPVSSAAIPH